MKYLELLSELALSFKSLNKFEKELNKILEKVGDSLNVSRIDIFFTEDEKDINEIFQWHNENHNLKTGEKKTISQKELAYLKNKINKEGYISLEKIKENPNKTIKTLIIYPIYMDSQVVGFIGIYEYNYIRKWKKEELQIFNTLSGLLSMAYERKLYKEKIINKEKEEKENLNMILKTFESNPVSMYISTMDKRELIKVNPKFIEKTGYSEKELLGKNIYELGLFVEKDKIEKIKEKTKNQEKVKDEELILKCKDGSLLSGLFTMETLKSQGREYFLTVMIDITQEQKNALELEIFFDINLDLLCIMDMDGKIMKINKTWDYILGYSSQELIGYNMLKFIHKEDMKKTLDEFENLRKGEKVSNFINRYVASSGETHYMEWKANPYEGVIYAAARDITKRIKYENMILDLSNRDSLTNTYNRRYFYKRLEILMEEYRRTQKEFSICILDIDSFKKVNDKYGHQTGDYVLKEFVKIIGKNLRPYDILGRYGGEEFIILLKNSSTEQSIIIIERILDSVRNTSFKFGNIDLKVAFSAGIANILELKNEQGIEDLIGLADSRMYKAKKTGKNKVVYKDDRR